MRIKFGEYDQIVTAWAESAAGPGWGNQPLWVLVKSQLDGNLRIECLQPSEQSKEQLTLYKLSEEAHRAMTDWTRHHLQSKDKSHGRKR